MKGDAPRQVAGLPFAAQVPFANDDLEVLKRYVGTRKRKVKSGKVYIYLCLFLLVATILLQLSGRVQIVLASISGGILFISIILCAQLTMLYQRQQNLIEADLEQGHLWRFEGKTIDSNHQLVKSDLLKNDLGKVQKVDVLPVSGKIHRTNNSLLWTWFSI